MDGFVSLPDSMDKVPVKILRDTGASESFVLESVLPFSGALSAGKTVLIQGKDLQTWQIVWAFSRSASYSEPVEMWICPSHSKVFGGGHGTSSPSEGVGYWKILRVNAFFRSSWLLHKFLSKFFYSCFAVDWFVKGSTKFEWALYCQRAFDNVKMLLVTATVLMSPRFYWPFKIQVDASQTGTGTVLLQTDESGMEHPVCFFEVVA